MSNRRRMPSAQTNPLDDEDLVDPGRGGATFEADGDIEDARLQTGMPARNLRNVAVGVMAIGLTAFLLWPSTGQKVKQEVPEPQPTDLVGDLVDKLQQVPPPVALPEYPEAPAPTPVVQASPPAVDERVELALISPMAATDVELRTAGQQKAQPKTTTNNELESVQALLAEQRQAKNEALARHAKLVETVAAGGGPGGSPGGFFGGGASMSAGQARSADHRMFLEGYAGNGDIGQATQLQAARIAPTLYEGTIIRTVLTRALNSDLPGTITARVTSDVYDSVSQRILLVPRGSEVTCSYDSNLMQGQKVILAACTRLRLPNGKSFALSGTPAGNQQGSTGIPAEIDNHFLEMFGTALIVGASSYLLPSRDRNISIVTGSEGGSQTAGNIMGSALSQVIQATIARNIQIPPTGTVEIGTPFTLTLTKDVEMEPYLASQRGYR